MVLDVDADFIAKKGLTPLTGHFPPSINLLWFPGEKDYKYSDKAGILSYDEYRVFFTKCVKEAMSRGISVCQVEFQAVFYDRWLDYEKRRHDARATFTYLTRFFQLSRSFRLFPGLVQNHLSERDVRRTRNNLIRKVKKTYTFVQLLNAYLAVKSMLHQYMRYANSLEAGVCVSHGDMHVHGGWNEDNEFLSKIFLVSNDSKSFRFLNFPDALFILQRAVTLRVKEKIMGVRPR